MSCQFFINNIPNDCFIENKQNIQDVKKKNIKSKRDNHMLLVVKEILKIKPIKKQHKFIQDDEEYDKLMKEILESVDKEKLSNNGEYNQRIKNINNNNLSNGRNIDELQYQRNQRIDLLNRLEFEKKIMTMNNLRYDELKSLMCKEKNDDVLNGDYYEDEIKKLDESYFIDGRTSGRIFRFLDIIRLIHESEDLKEDGYVNGIINRSKISDDDKIRLHNIRRDILKIQEKYYSEIFKKIKEGIEFEDDMERLMKFWKKEIDESSLDNIDKKKLDDLRFRRIDKIKQDKLNQTLRKRPHEDEVYVSNKKRKRLPANNKYKKIKGYPFIHGYIQRSLWNPLNYISPMGEIFDSIQSINLIIDEYKKSLNPIFMIQMNVEKIRKKLQLDMSKLETNSEKRKFLEKITKILVTREKDDDEGIFDLFDFEY
jgi:hypothetical protein